MLVLVGEDETAMRERNTQHDAAIGLVAADLLFNAQSEIWQLRVKRATEVRSTTVSQLISLGDNLSN